MPSIRLRLLTNYAWPEASSRSSWLLRHILWPSSLAYRLASDKHADASRLCAARCAELLPQTADNPIGINRQIRVIEIGCGSGHALAELSLLRPDVQLIGIDASQMALDQAARRLASAATPVHFYKCLADNLIPVGTASCRAVAHVNCWGVWRGGALLAAVCSEAFRVLAPGGFLVSTADCELSRRFTAELGGPDLLAYLAALEAAGFVRLRHQREACLGAAGRKVHVVIAEAPA